MVYVVEMVLVKQLYYVPLQVVKFLVRESIDYIPFIHNNLLPLNFVLTLLSII